MYENLPFRRSGFSPSAFECATPKSTILVTPAYVTITLLGDRSQWITPRSCAHSSPRAHSPRDAQREPRGHGPAARTDGAQDLGERGAVDVLHREQVDAPVLREVEHLDEVRVVELAARARLVREHVDVERILLVLGQERLQHDGLREAAVAARLREPHLAHAAVAEAVDETVFADGVPGLHRRGFRAPRPRYSNTSTPQLSWPRPPMHVISRAFAVLPVTAWTTPATMPASNWQSVRPTGAMPEHVTHS